MAAWCIYMLTVRSILQQAKFTYHTVSRKMKVLLLLLLHLCLQFHMFHTELCTR